MSFSLSLPLSLMSQSNLGLFRAEPSSEEWKAYVEYIDDMVIDGFFTSIERSLKFFLDNTGIKRMQGQSEKHGIVHMRNHILIRAKFKMSSKKKYTKLL